MSDTSDEGWKRRYREGGDENPLREEMRAFVEEHPPQTGLKALRERTSGGSDLATIVDENREEPE